MTQEQGDMIFGMVCWILLLTAGRTLKVSERICEDKIVVVRE